MFQYQILMASPDTVIDLLDVQSFEMGIYLVRLTIGSKSALVYDGDVPMRFKSSQHIREAFSGIAVRAACMTHDSPYDEMIGNPSSSLTSRLPFSMVHPY
ncbi:DUF6482 family protein [Aestuariibacter halophilus]|uniref:DUF6482 family protein n=1 Tax=Fluctibacter halophilus TaxID=226011 RepID=A0ABS8G946_9ALTE|nr:DUF6482 family protein [Aestuariibacter halophilus]MCC2616968.1 DUF6482 family protein [Aestuariibacter halophilus]